MFPASSIGHLRTTAAATRRDRLLLTAPLPATEGAASGAVDEAGEPVAPVGPPLPPGSEVLLSVACSVVDGGQAVLEASGGASLDADALVRVDPGALPPQLERRLAASGSDVTLQAVFGPYDMRVVRRGAVVRVRHGRASTRLLVRWLTLAEPYDPDDYEATP